MILILSAYKLTDKGELKIDYHLSKNLNTKKLDVDA